ncbi:hypothetical protein IJ732_05365 [bacterium]|nr:hypothetical protein [bacterium]
MCYVQVMHDIEICELNSSNLQPVILYRILSVKKETSIGGGLLPISVKTIPTEKQILSAQECQNIVNHFWIFKSDKNPFFVIMKIYHNAYREYYKDNFAQSIIQMQTYIETFIKIVFSQIMSETGFFEQQINKIIEETPFLSLIKKEMPEKLGGCWNITTKGKEVFSWYENTYLLRNRIIHNGYNPNRDETDSAFNSAEKFLNFIYNRIKSNKNKYTHLNEYLV